MGYKRQTFVDGETVLSAGHLEHIEEGIIEAEQNHNSLQREVETLKQNGTGSGGAEVTAENIKSALGYTPADDADVSKLQEEIVDHEADETVHVTASEKQAWNGKEASGTAQTKVTEHNVSEESHSDIRLLITNLITRLNTIANSEDVDLDQLSELVAYIKSNRTLIEEVTTNKVNVSDIIDNLTTSVSNKPLSAKQGVQLKALIDGCVKSVNGKTGAVTITGEDIEDGTFKFLDMETFEVIEDTGMSMGNVNMALSLLFTYLNGMTDEFIEIFIPQENLKTTINSAGQLQDSYVLSEKCIVNFVKEYVQEQLNTIQDGNEVAY